MCAEGQHGQNALRIRRTAVTIHGDSALILRRLLHKQRSRLAGPHWAGQVVCRSLKPLPLFLPCIAPPVAAFPISFSSDTSRGHDCFKNKVLYIINIVNYSYINLNYPQLSILFNMSNHSSPSLSPKAWALARKSDRVRYAVHLTDGGGSRN